MSLVSECVTGQPSKAESAKQAYGGQMLNGLMSQVRQRMMMHDAVKSNQPTAEIKTIRTDYEYGR